MADQDGVINFDAGTPMFFLKLNKPPVRIVALVIKAP